MNLLRDRWRNDGAFRLAALAAAIGSAAIDLPGLAIAHGGGAFFVPFLITAWLVARPLLAFEFGLGLCYQGSLPEALRKLAKRWEWLGWWAVCAGALVALCQAALVVWLALYAYDAALAITAGQPVPWGSTVDATQAYLQETLGMSSVDDPGAAASATRPIGGALLALALVWLGLHAVIGAGLGRLALGVVVTMIVSALCLITAAVVVARMPGAIDGIARMLSPEWGALADLDTWTAAAVLVLRAAAIGTGVHVALASFLNRNADGTGSASLVLYAALAATVAMASIIAAALGVQAMTAGVPIESLPTRGVEALFTTVAAAFAGAHAPTWAGTLGALTLFLGFAGAVLIALATSVAACVSALVDRSDIVWRPASARIATAGFLAGVPFATSHGWLAREALSGAVFATGPALTAAGLTMLIAWVVGIDGLQRHLGAYSVTPPGRWWRRAVSTLAPSVLIALVVATWVDLLRAPGSPLWAVLAFGLAPCVVAGLFALTVARAAPRRMVG